MVGYGRRAREATPILLIACFSAALKTRKHKYVINWNLWMEQLGYLFCRDVDI